MGAYYNEIDPKAAAWLRELIERGLIAPGEVDERSILEVQPGDLAGFDQCHFFAGIGVWSYALRSAGWADDRPVWTGSCPCQPFSAAGKGDEFADERHLWPAWFRLIRERRPVAVFGEQVASKDALSWLDHVSTDLEAEGYAVGAVDTCAAGFGAPEVGQRLFFVAQANHAQRRPDLPARNYGSGQNAVRAKDASDLEICGVAGALVETDSQRHSRPATWPEQAGRTVPTEPGHVNGFWSGVEWVYCDDPDGPVWRPVKPGTFPLVTGAPARVVRLRGYGNAINAEQARHFIEAFIEVRGGLNV